MQIKKFKFIFLDMRKSVICLQILPTIVVEDYMAILFIFSIFHVNYIFIYNFHSNLLHLFLIGN